MFLNEQHRAEVIENFRESGNSEAIEAIEDEFYADRSMLINWLVVNDYQVTSHQINEILSMIYASKIK